MQNKAKLGQDGTSGGRRATERAMVQNEPNLAGRLEPRRAKCAKRTQFGPPGHGVPGPGVRSEGSSLPPSDFKPQTSHFSTEIAQNKANFLQSNERSKYFVERDLW
jgi:hypothetical protein